MATILWLALILLLPGSSAAQVTSSTNPPATTATPPVEASEGNPPQASTLEPLVSLNGQGVMTHVVEAQTAYRGGLESGRRGQGEAARRLFAEAARLDPTFPDPWFATAASWLPFRPDMAMASVIEGCKSSWRSFRGQHRLIMNSALLLLGVLVFSLMGTTFLIALRGLRHFQHPIFEVLRRRLPVMAAAIAGWIIVLQPLLWGLGAFLSLMLASGLLWFYVGKGERRVLAAYATLAIIVPMAFHGLSRLSAPLNPESVPYLLSAASETPDQPGLSDALARAMQDNPADPGPHMALGLTMEHAGQYEGAEKEYRAALENQGDEGRVRNNLGNIMALSGRLDGAVEQYQKSIATAPWLAAPHFNLSQIYARRLQFDLADNEMKQASQLDFESVRSHTASLGQKKAGLVSLGLAPRDLWSATLARPAAFPIGVPRSMAWLYGGAMGMLPLFSIALIALGLLVGQALHRFLPTYACANCDCVVCRKCLRRIRRRAYCEPCGDTILSMQTSEFTRMLLERRLNQDHWGRRLARLALVLAIPGWEAVRRGRPMIGLTVMTGFVLLIVPVITGGRAIGPTPGLAGFSPGPLWSVLLPGLFVLYGLSALLLKLMPEPESALIGQDLAGPSGRDRLDRAA
ncbi:MAG TPA: tetratricopeptide repeat protein [Candidatus Eisenbacteria bacterium]